LEPLRIRRDAQDGCHSLLDVFKGFERCPAIDRILKGRRQILEDVRVRIGPSPQYMRVMEEDGYISIGRNYLRHGSSVHIYLDLVHELTHVRQHKEGLPLYDERYRYIDRPTEMEAMSITVAEARRLGLSEEELGKYLGVPWIAEHEYAELLVKLGVRWHPEGRKPHSAKENTPATPGPE